MKWKPFVIGIRKEVHQNSVFSNIIDGESNGPDLVGFRILFEFRFSRFDEDLCVI